MITYQTESWDSYYRDCQELWAENCTELGNGKVLNPDVATYRSLEQLGMLVIITARNEGQLIAYRIFAVRGNLHHRDVLTAFEDSMFITKAFRFGRVAIKLLTVTENIMKILNVQEITCIVNASGGTGRLMEKCGFELNSLVYSKRI